MINRAEQNWPEDMTVSIDSADTVNHEPELPEDSIYYNYQNNPRFNQPEPVNSKWNGLNPYTHELSCDGSGCANDCPACMFIELNFLDSELRSQYSEPVDEMERRTR